MQDEPIKLEYLWVRPRYELLLKLLKWFQYVDKTEKHCSNIIILQAAG